MLRPAHDRRGDVALVVAAICFGSTFIAVQGAVERVEPIPFLAVRFLIAAAVLWLIARRRPSQPARACATACVAGAALLLGYVLQTIGLQYTSSATSAFITYLLVVFVPLLGFVLLGRRPHPVTLRASRWRSSVSCSSPTPAAAARRAASARASCSRSGARSPSPPTS